MNNSESKGITKISISGFKSIANECSIDIRPLTILAGANSSGKSSIMQPLLLMKQTLESPYSYGGLSLNGENIRFTSVKQILSRFSKANQQDIFTVQIDIDINRFCRLKFQNIPDVGLQTVETSYSFEDYLQHLVKTFNKVTLSPEMTREEIIKALPPETTRSYEIHKEGSLNYKITNFYYYLICTVPEIGFPIYNPTPAFSTEISEIIRVPITHLMDPTFYRSKPVPHEGRNYRIHYYDYQAHTIWGITGYIVNQFLKMLSESQS